LIAGPLVLFTFQPANVLALTLATVRVCFLFPTRSNSTLFNQDL